MAWVEPGKWTCSRCNRTVSVYGSEADVACCIKACQERHARAHNAAQAVLRTLGLPPKPARRGREKRGAA